VTVTITQNMTDIAGIADNTVVWFSQVGDPRQGEDDSIMITTRRVGFTPVNGVLTATAEPGPALVEIGARRYPIVVPDADAMLWPLIEVGLAAEPPQAWSVVNAGGIARMKAVTQSEFSALATPDPETVYFVVPDA
jgi:hypothetical protein